MFIYKKKQTKKNTTKRKKQTKQHSIKESLFCPHNIQKTTTTYRKLLLPLEKLYQSFMPTHNQSLRTPIIRRNLPKIQTPRASPDEAVEQKTIQKRGRPVDEPTESGKPRATDEKRLARTPTTKESGSA
jgi:hypothetical protein